MAESIKVVDPDSGSGYDYDSLYDWEAGEQADIDSSGTIAVAKCRCTGGTADTTAVTIDGWTTSADDYIKIWTDTTESYRHNGTYQTGNKYRISITLTTGYSAIHCLKISELHVFVDGIQTENILANYSNQIPVGILFGSASDAYQVIISSCITKLTSGAYTAWYSSGIEFIGSSSAVIKIKNCLAYGWTGSAEGRGFNENSGSSVAYVYNCTAVGCGTGFKRGGSGTIAWKNCGASGCSTGFSGGTQTTCSSSTPTFVGAPDYHLAAADETWLGQGSNLYNDANLAFQDDIDGDDRGGSGATWDIGADEYVSGATLIQYSFRARKDDGDEAGASFLAEAINTDFKAPAGTNIRIRFLIDTSGDVSSSQFQLEFAPSGNNTWTKV
jgi:hypothetical protein